MTYLGLMAEDVESAKRKADGPVPKTGLRRFHERITEKWKGAR